MNFHTENSVKRKYRERTNIVAVMMVDLFIRYMIVLFVHNVIVSSWPEQNLTL